MVLTRSGTTSPALVAEAPAADVTSPVVGPVEDVAHTSLLDAQSPSQFDATTAAAAGAAATTPVMMTTDQLLLLIDRLSLRDPVSAPT